MTDWKKKARKAIESGRSIELALRRELAESSELEADYMRRTGHPSEQGEDYEVDDD